MVRRCTVGLVVVIMALAFPHAARSQEEGVVYDKNRPNVIVWRSEYAMKDGLALLEAGQVDLAAKYVACANGVIHVALALDGDGGFLALSCAASSTRAGRESPEPDAPEPAQASPPPTGSRPAGSGSPQSA